MIPCAALERDDVRDEKQAADSFFRRLRACLALAVIFAALAAAFPAHAHDRTAGDGLAVVTVSAAATSTLAADCDGAHASPGGHGCCAASGVCAPGLSHESTADVSAPPPARLAIATVSPLGGNCVVPGLRPPIFALRS